MIVLVILVRNLSLQNVDALRWVASDKIAAKKVAPAVAKQGFLEINVKKVSRWFLGSSFYQFYEYFNKCIDFSEILILQNVIVSRRTAMDQIVTKKVESATIVNLVLLETNVKVKANVTIQAGRFLISLKKKWWSRSWFLHF